VRVQIIRPGLRETGSAGTAVPVGDDYFVTLDRSEPPYRGVYLQEELEFLEEVADSASGVQEDKC